MENKINCVCVRNVSPDDESQKIESVIQHRRMHASFFSGKCLKANIQCECGERTIARAPLEPYGLCSVKAPLARGEGQCAQPRSMLSGQRLPGALSLRICRGSPALI